MTKTRWYNNGITEILINENDQIPDGFVKGRLHRYCKFDSIKERISKDELYRVYIIENTPFHKLPEIFDVTPKEARKLLTYYKIRKDLKEASKNNTYRRTHEESLAVGKKSAETQRNTWKNKTDEERSQWAEKQRQSHLNMSEAAKQQQSERLSAYWWSLSEEQRQNICDKKRNTCKQLWQLHGDELLRQRKETERENRKNRLCRSASEQKMFDVLITIYTDTQYDVRVDDRYPYYCDFYIPSLDMFIELNAHPSHGRLPISLLSVDEYAQYPQKWIDVFARRDVEKQKCATTNHLNYVMIYPKATLEENLKLNSVQNTEFITKLYNSQK